MKRSRDKIERAGPVELGERELGEIAGGIELKPVYISSYSLSSGGEAVQAGFGGGPHVKVFDGRDM